MTDELRDELRNLRLDYLLSTRETVELMKQHAKALGGRNQFKTSFPVLLYLSHQLKGSGGTLGFQEISDLAGRMSNELNRFFDDAAPRPEPDELSQSILTISNELEAGIDKAEQSLRTSALEEKT